MGFWDFLKDLVLGRDPDERDPPGRGRPGVAPSAPSAGTSTAGTRADRPPAAGYDAPKDILGLDEDALRRRALTVEPWRTAFIGRTDLIPPQSDERTAIIDRGLELRGLLTREELDDIHRVGDLWMRHKEAALAAHLAGLSAGQKAVTERIQERLLRRENKRAAARQRREERTAAVAKRRATDILYLGHGVSGDLWDRRSHVEKLAAQGLPVLSSPAEVAHALGIPVPVLRWLCFHADAATRVHYVSFEIPKRSGGMRTISAPHRTLAAAQRWVLQNILEKLPVEAPAHGFVKGRSTVTNARPHLKRAVVVNLDVKDFFPSITFARVRGVFAHLGYSPAASTVLALLCTECPRRKVNYAGADYFVAVGPRGLPQGACTSPALSNQVTRHLDRRLTGRARGMGFTYTRYADDLTFSSENAEANVGRLMAAVRHTLDDEGFEIHPDKGRVHRRHTRQLVTGVVVNEETHLARDEVRRLRAILHQARKTGLEAQNRQGLPHFESWLRGKIAYLQMVDRPRGEKLMAELNALTAAQPGG